jgi:hypothetical protein
MNKKPLVSRAKFEEDIEADDASSKVTFKPREEMVKVSEKASSISIPEFLVDEPYPYFYHTWNKLLMCNLNDVTEIFHINDQNDLDQNIYINNNLPDTQANLNNFATQHAHYGNSLQNYYTIINQSGTIDANWKEMERIDITSITPVYLQKCENIMTTLLFMCLFTTLNLVHIYICN